MAKIINLERNVEFNIWLRSNNMLDYSPKRSDYENWIPFILCLNVPNRCSAIDENAKATMTIFELKNFIHGIENVLVHLDNQEDYIFKFNSSEGFFELKAEVVPEDNAIEIELWINVGNQTKGEIFGFDEGVRWITGKEELNDFLTDFKEEFYKIKDL